MKAIIIKEYGNVDQLNIGEYPTPQPQQHDVLIRVETCGINRADILQRKGKYPPPPGTSPLLGLEAAGVVERCGSQCTLRKPGDRVMGILAGGGYAEYVVMHEEIAMSIPDTLSFEQAAAIPEAFITAYQAMFWLGKLQQGNSVLVHAGASGVGTAALQLAKAFGINAIATAGSEEKLKACIHYGAISALNYHNGPFADNVMDFTGGKGINAILDFIGASFWTQNLSVLAPDGRLVIISMLGGSKVETVNLAEILMKRIHIVGTTLRGRSLDYKIALTQEFTRRALPLFADARLQPVIDSIFPWSQVRDAHLRIESNLNIGKILLVPDTHKSQLAS
jgi:putative PIG3 family NAD(P)H quinone oxidoreductase